MGLGPLGLSAAAGVGRDDVLALGSNGTMLSFEEGARRNVGSYANVTLCSLWVDDPSTAWAVGTDGGVTRFSLDEFVDVDSGIDAFLFGVHGSSIEHVWIAGWNRTILRVVEPQ
ncbi:MAG: hypothetical protein FJ137_02945 [Deltaproteobacteria bacterium]|nr:hypothetical protein [Deltaproteobacteria bacterium]